MDNPSFPLVSVGIPTYNEAEYIRASLDNLLSQTYPNIQITISDNASTDGTSDIAAEYAKAFPNITHVRHETNIGQHANFNYLPTAATGTYFLWAAGHDLLEQTFIASAVEALQTHPTAVLAFPRTIDILADGTPFNENSRVFDILKADACKRFTETMWRVDCNYVYGVYKREPMLRTHLFQAIPAPDRVFLSEMAVLGPFVPANTIRYCRMNRGKKQTEVEKRHRLMRYIIPDRTFTDAELMTNRFYEPTFRAFHRVVSEGNFSFFETIRLHFSVWLAGVMKAHMFPGADVLSKIVKTCLPRPILKKILAKMQ